MAKLTFTGGIHPYDGKDLSKDKPIKAILPKGDLVYPMLQHIGAPAVPVVAKGDKVLTGQKIAEAGGFVSAPIYATVSGTVKAIEPRRIVTGDSVNCIIIENDGLYEEVEYAPVKPLEELSGEEIINKIEFGTSRLSGRIEAINKLVEAGYIVGILVAPIILVDNWKTLYEELLKELSNKLSLNAKNKVFFELIFMTYSYVHNAINHEAFPNAIDLYNKELMTGRGKGKYAYKPAIKEEAKKDMEELMYKYFPKNEIKYIV